MIILTARKLLETAMRFFAEKGYEGTTMADIAGAVGIKKPSIYAHYPSKMEMFRAVVAIAKADYRRCWDEALAATAAMPADRRLFELFRAVGEHIIADRTKMNFWVRLWIFPPAECAEELVAEMKEMNRGYRLEVAGIFRQGMSEGVIRPEANEEELAHTFFALLIGFLMRAILYKELNSAEALRQTWAGFFTGVGGNDCPV